MERVLNLRIENLQRSGISATNLTIQMGECVCLSGPSGAGKTLLLRCIADLYPHGGETYLDSEPCSLMPASKWRSRVGLLAAESHWWCATVGEHFTEGFTVAMEALGFPAEVMGWDISRLSSGERQRLALLRLLEHKPEILLLDEPTANLDTETAHNIIDLMMEINDRDGTTFIFATHDQRLLERVNRQILLRDGVICEDKTL